MSVIRSFRELDVYQLARQQSKVLFDVSKRFPREEMYSLTDQICRSSRAVSAMIAEAWARRRYPAVFVNKISEAIGEASETAAWLDHALDCEYLSQEQYAELNGKWHHVGAMLYRMMERRNDFCRFPSSDGMRGRS